MKTKQELILALTCAAVTFKLIAEKSEEQGNIIKALAEEVYLDAVMNGEKITLECKQ